ncbi:MAG TPA: hypothetical protein DCS29_01935 [Candidatus Magasanikbacteria bacterium]|nr:MAG: hypothetical protein A2479_02810 [Candidatus Magasanikbacteria bacterium RIFOXYC2_FULL_39_8]HAT03518.1 hypothetical protein [Candidatus Magasanikbacteria bacterium]
MKQKIILDTLQSAGYKFTKTRKKICDTITQTKKLFCVADISHTIPQVNQASVYRTFEILETLNLITPTIKIDGQQYYEKHDESHHHHHIICKRCKKTKCVDCNITTSSISGFTQITHATVLVGVCNSCS